MVGFLIKDEEKVIKVINKDMTDCDTVRHLA